jgi:hypothetical protein
VQGAGGRINIVGMHIGPTAEKKHGGVEFGTASGLNAHVDFDRELAVDHLKTGQLARVSLDCDALPSDKSSVRFEVGSGSSIKILREEHEPLELSGNVFIKAHSQGTFDGNRKLSFNSIDVRASSQSSVKGIRVVGAGRLKSSSQSNITCEIVGGARVSAKERSQGSICALEMERCL